MDMCMKVWALVFSKSLKEHATHVWTILQTLRKERLYANMEKCLFGVDKLAFLRFFVSSKGFMSMSPRSMLLRLGHNQPICNKCVAFLALRVSTVALSRILAPLLRLCTLSARRMRLLFGDHPKIPHSMSLRICLLMLPCLYYQTLASHLKFIAMLVVMA